MKNNKKESNKRKLSKKLKDTIKFMIFGGLIVTLLALIPIYYFEVNLIIGLSLSFVAGIIIAIIIAIIRVETFIDDSNLKQLNKGKFFAGNISEIEPKPSMYKQASSDIDRFIIRHSRFFAIKNGTSVSVILIYFKGIKIKAIRHLNISTGIFFKYFDFSEFSAPEEEEEILLKLQ